MREIVVLGGYGRVGQLCVSRLVEATGARVVVAGRSIQRAQQAASAFGERTRAAYGDAADLRTLGSLIPGAAAVVACCGASQQAALDLAIETRVPYIGLTTLQPGVQRIAQLQERAWQAQVPVILHAGAIPGLPGVLAEFLVRRYPSLYKIRIASTGAWGETETAQRDWKALRESPELGEDGQAAERSWRRLRWRFPDPIGVRWLRPAWSADLCGFVRSHCVERLLYLEPDTGLLARGLQHILQLDSQPSFALIAEAYLDQSSREPQEFIALQAPDLLTAAVASAVEIVRRVMRRSAPAGFFTPREALNPAVFLQGLAKRGVRVTSSGEG